jgi:pimeloyl-ACP methyl ester carboxylesterase
MAWFEHRNSRIYYEEEGSGEPLLLLPGWSGSIGDLLPVRQALAPHYRLIAADPPGSGQSGPQPREYSASYYEDDSYAFLALLDGLSASPAHLVGFSDGGEYALLMGELKQAAIRSIVTWGAAGKLAFAPEFLAEFGQIIDDPIPALREFSGYLKATYGEENARTMAQTAAKAWGTIIEAGGDISRKRVGEITCPALLITGEQDSIFAPPSLVSEMAAAMQHAQFIEAKDAGHLIHHENPDWLAGTIVNWLSQQ